MIYTFYSYKGGVGRSMALANVAQWFYQQGLRVVMIDWDLEAPGMENYFCSTEEQLELARSQIGLIDLLTAYKRQFASLPVSEDETQDQNFLDLLQKHLSSINLALYAIYPSDSSSTGRALWLIPAGLRAGDRFSLYSQMVQSFDWADFYSRFRGELYFEWLRSQLESLADVVLIDSRTGVTEMSGVCTRQLADVVVSFCGPNRQSIAGVARMVESFLREDVLKVRKGRSLDMVVVPARVDNSEQDARRQFRKQFNNTFDRYAPLAFKQVKQVLWDLRIPYIPEFAYTERLTIGTTEQAEDLEEAYKRLAASFVLLSPQESMMRSRFSAELQRLFVFDSFVPRVFISYAYSDGEPFAANLRQRLKQEDISLWEDSSVGDMDNGRERWSQIAEALHQSEFLVLVMTPGALQSSIVREEWRYARQKGICVLPVIAHPQLDFRSLPRWMRAVHFYDLDQEWHKFVNDLRTRCQQPRIPFMAENLPGDFVPRPREMAEMLDMLLDTKREEPIPATVALFGAGGYGKTMLAKALCHEERIQDAFDDGILWITLGANPGNLTGKIEDLIYILGQERVSFTHIDAAAARFEELLSGRDILLIIDDVWNAEDLKPFLRGGNHCARLITTRNESVLPLNARRIGVGAISQQEAMQFLSTSLSGVKPSSDALNKLRTLASRLGKWPLVLNLANGVLRERVSKYQQPLSDALAYINKALDKRGLTAFDARDVQDRSQAVAQTLGVSFELLSVAEYARYKELAVFSEDVNIPLVTLQKLWGATGGLDGFDTEALCERLYGLSLLLDFNLTGRTIRLHDAVHIYLRQEMGEDLAGLHRQLLKTYALTRWADLPLDEPYLWDHLADHLVGARNVEELLETVKDLRYLATKTLVRNSSAVEADLLIAQNLAPDDIQVGLLKRNIAQMGPLLNRGETFADIAAVLHSRLMHLSELADLCRPLELELARHPYLTPLHTLPDLPYPGLMRTLPGHIRAVTGCAISPQGDWIVSASEDKTLKLWDAHTGQERLTLQGHTGVVNDCAISPQGDWIVSASEDKTLKLWDAHTGQELLTLRGHDNAVIACAVSLDLIASASSDRTLRVWDHNTGAALLVLEGNADTVSACAISPSGDLIVSASRDGTLKVWDAHKGEVRQVLRGHVRAVRDCAISPAGDFIVSASDDTTLRLWDAHTGEGRLILHGHDGVVRSCAISPAGDFIVSASSDKTLKLWDMHTGAERLTLYGHSSAVRDCAISPAGDFIVSASSDKTLKLWDTRAGSEPFTPDVQKGIVNACAVPATESFIVAALNNGTLKFWDISTGQERETLQGHTGAVTSCAVSPAGNLIVSASEDKTLKLWDTSTRRERLTLQGHTGVVNDCAISPQGDWIVSASQDKTLKLWDISTGQERETLQGHAGAVTSCAVSPAGNLIVSASEDKTLKLWDAATGRELLIFSGHAGAVYSCAVSPAGNLIVSASEDKTLKLWDAATGRELLIFSGHAGAVHSCAMSAQGNLVVSVSEDGALKVWDVQSGICLSTFFVDGELLACAFYNDISIVAGGRGGMYFLRFAR